MLPPGKSYDAVYNAFRWNIPARVNMGVQVCDRHAAASPDRTALIVATADSTPVTYAFKDIRRLSNQLANLLTGRGCSPGDRVGILLSQSVEAAVAHVATWKMGAISIPLFKLFGEEALHFRLADSGAKILITDIDQLEKITPIRDRLPELDTILVVDQGFDDGDCIDFWRTMENAADAFTPLDTAADDPSFIVYTSGTTGNPKGALHAHRALIGHMPGVEFFHEFLPQPDDLMWTPADWAWIGGLMNCLMGAWYHAVPVLAYRASKYDPEEALHLMKDFQVRNTFMPPTALKVMREVAPSGRLDVNVRSVAVAGEPMGAELLDWGREAFGVTFNEFYGQTECNLVMANNSACMPIKAGSMGRPAPGHVVTIIDDDGNEMPPGTIGQIAVRRPDPVMLLYYWNRAEDTAAKFIDDWWPMGDQAYTDDEGYFWFVGRDDDVITTAGYRVGPGEIEDCLSRHPAVSLAAAIGVPDPVRTENIKVFIKLMPGFDGDRTLEKELQGFVKQRLSPHEYPRVIEFVNDLPLTSTGKIRRKDLRDMEQAKTEISRPPR